MPFIFLYNHLIWWLYVSVYFLKKCSLEVLILLLNEYTEIELLEEKAECYKESVINNENANNWKGKQLQESTAGL